MTDLAITSPVAPRLWSHEVRATLALSWPMVLTNLVQTAMTATDVVMLGWLGPNALAAGTLGTNLYFAFLIFGIGLVSAVAPLIARELGAKRHSVRDVRRTVRQGLWSVVAMSLPIWAITWNGEAILVGLLGQDPDLAASAGQYLRALQWSLLPFLGYLVLRSFIAALERPVWGLWIGLVGWLVNALAAWCLIFGNLGFPRLELVGAGIATTIASTVLFVGLALVLVLDRTFRRYRIFGRFWRADWQRFAQVWRLGLPIAAAVVFEVTIFNAAVFLMGLINAASLAAHAIAVQIASLTFMVPMGIGQAVTVRVGRALGAGDRDGITRAGWTAFALGIGFMTLMAIVMLSAPTLLISAFLNISEPANAPVVQLAVLFLAFAALFQIVDGAQAVALGMLRGLQDTRVPMIFAAIGYWGIGLPLGAVLAFPLGLDGVGIWIGLASGLAVVAVLLTLRWLRRDALGLTSPALPAVGDRLALGAGRKP